MGRCLNLLSKPQIEKIFVLTESYPDCMVLLKEEKEG